MQAGSGVRFAILPALRGQGWSQLIWFRVRVKGLGFRVKGLKGFKGFKGLKGLKGFKGFKGFGFRVQRSGFRV